MLLYFNFNDFQNLVEQPKTFAYVGLTDIVSLQHYSPVKRAVPF